MKAKFIWASLLTVALAGAGVTNITAKEDKNKEAKLEAQAKVSKAEAEKAALAKVPNGTVKEGEIEKEDGKLIWSFDITTPNTKDITEVQVDANTGAVLKTEVESAKDEKAEAEKEGKGHEDKDDKDDKK